MLRARHQTHRHHQRPPQPSPKRRARVTPVRPTVRPTQQVAYLKAGAHVFRDGRYVTAFTTPGNNVMNLARQSRFTSEGWQGHDTDTSELRNFLSLLSKASKRHRVDAPGAQLLIVRSASGKTLPLMTDFAVRREHMPYRCNFSGKRIIRRATPAFLSELRQWYMVSWRLHEPEWVGMVLPSQGRQTRHTRRR